MGNAFGMIPGLEPDEWSNDACRGYVIMAMEDCGFSKKDIVNNIRALPVLAALDPFIPQVLIAAKIVLHIPLGNQLLVLEIIKGRQEVAHPKERAKQDYKILLVLFALNEWLNKREFFRKLLNHIKHWYCQPLCAKKTAGS